MPTSSSTPNPSPRRKPPMAMITAGLAIAAVLGAIIVTQAGGGARFEDGQASINVATVCECQHVVYYYAPGVDTQQATEVLFEALRRVEGVGRATAYKDPPSIRIGFCQSAISEPELRDALTQAQAGILAPVGGTSPATPAPAPAPATPGFSAPAPTVP